MKNPARVVIVDNHPASSADFRTALEAQPDLTLAAAVTCASCSFAAVSEHKPDLVLIRLNLPGHRVLQLVKDLLVLHAGLKLLVFSGHDDELEPSRVLRAGAQGCVLRSSSMATKLDAIRKVLAGSHCFSTQSTPRRPDATALRSSVNAAFSL
ncbi:MAG: response regulator transcription factor [Prosthecobacter sp.]|uniref:response regulator n=1 Tax=Prosthecobacter sp. TaxID=1965333 RepID=UPI0025F1130D|nr:response regulator transcription factor [Prosthecobacter sp.]MCF7785733.1 response regulator transcription factor [Prosthecobacter sp.]